MVTPVRTVKALEYICRDGRDNSTFNVETLEVNSRTYYGSHEDVMLRPHIAIYSTLETYGDVPNEDMTLTLDNDEYISIFFL